MRRRPLRRACHANVHGRHAQDRIDHHAAGRHPLRRRQLPSVANCWPFAVPWRRVPPGTAAGASTNQDCIQRLLPRATRAPHRRCDLAIQRSTSSDVKNRRAQTRGHEGQRLQTSRIFDSVIKPVLPGVTPMVRVYRASDRPDEPFAALGS